MKNLSDHRKLEVILAHVRKVEDNMLRVARELLLTDRSFALELVKRARTHDLSKFEIDEFNHLWPEDEKFSVTLSKHRERNRHHPEMFENIHCMSDLDIAEMACDWAARAQEFGTDVRTWVFEHAARKYKFTREDNVGSLVEKYLSLALSEPFRIQQT